MDLGCVINLRQREFSSSFWLGHAMVLSCVTDLRLLPVVLVVTPDILPFLQAALFSRPPVWALRCGMSARRCYLY